MLLLFPSTLRRWESQKLKDKSHCVPGWVFWSSAEVRSLWHLLMYCSYSAEFGPELQDPVPSQTAQVLLFIPTAVVSCWDPWVEWFGQTSDNQLFQITWLWPELHEIPDLSHFCFPSCKDKSWQLSHARDKTEPVPHIWHRWSKIKSISGLFGTIKKKLKWLPRQWEILVFQFWCLNSPMFLLSLGQDS